MQHCNALPNLAQLGLYKHMCNVFYYNNAVKLCIVEGILIHSDSWALTPELNCR